MKLTAKERAAICAILAEEMRRYDVRAEMFENASPQAKARRLAAVNAQGAKLDGIRDVLRVLGLSFTASPVGDFDYNVKLI